MDLPVIMCSEYSDTKLVMKGISHGACDYLLKPVRIEELKNIWQHVVRRKKFDFKGQNKSVSQDKACHEAGEGGQGILPAGSSDQNDKLNRKRKDQNEHEEYEEGEQENEDTSTQKKPRVVWSPELHQKFVAAVNQLGLDKAVPKKILDLMNVEGITRENVASHLQKFRQCLKRVATEQASMDAAFAGKDSSYMRMGTLDGIENLRSLAGSWRLSNAALSSYTPSGNLGRLNSSDDLSIRGITSSVPGHSRILSNYVNTRVKLQPALSANQSPNLYQAIPTSLELNQLQQSKYTAHIGESNPSNDPTSSTVLHGNQQQTHATGVFANQSSLRVASLNPESFDIGISHFPDHNRSNESWQVAVQLSNFPSNALPMSEPVNHGQLNTNDLGISSSRPQIGNVPSDFLASVFSAPAEELRRNISNQECLIGDDVPTLNFTPLLRSEEHTQDYNHNVSLTFNALDSTVSANVIVGPASQSLDPNDAVCSKNMNSSLYDQLNGATPTVMQPGEVDKPAMETEMNPTEDYPWEETKPQDGSVQNSYDSLNDIMSAILQQEQNDNILMDGEFGFDGYSNGPGSCI